MNKCSLWTAVRRDNALSLLATFVALWCVFVFAPPAWCEFTIAPYLQVGDNYKIDSRHGCLMLRWVSPCDQQVVYKVEVKSGKDWRELPLPSAVDLKIEGSPALKIYSEQLDDLDTGTDTPYRVLADGKVAFSASARAPKSKGQPCKLIFVGDCGDGSTAQKKLAVTMACRPVDLAVIVGDIVYPNGLLSEYLGKFFPVYNADKVSAGRGGPMMREIPFIACPGNHDTCVEGKIDGSDLAECPDGLAYYYLWRQPLNGPALAANLAPNLRGSDKQVAAFLQAANSAFPRMSNFSLDYGSAHILCLDANPYVDWTNAQLQQWVDQDLQAASSMPWKIVVFHQACFSSDKNHFEDQQMRLLAPIFEKRNVDVVFAGHSHSYQRSLPLRFVPSQPAQRSPEGFVYGRLQLDRQFDDKPHQKPNGIIYVVTGGGGAPLSIDPGASNRDAWQPFTKLYRNDIHCFSECEITDRDFVFKQIADDGKVIDGFQLRK